MAVTATVAGDGTPTGAVYNPLAETVPFVRFPPGTPLTFQVTAVFEVPLTFDVNCCVPETTTSALDGETATETTDTTVALAVAL